MSRRDAHRRGDEPRRDDGADHQQIADDEIVEAELLDDEPDRSDDERGVLDESEADGTEGDLGSLDDLDAELAGVIDANRGGTDEALAAERDSFRDLAMRVQADFDNYRKRINAQHAEDVERAQGRIAEALLPVLDATEAAYVQHPTEVGPLLNQLLVELRKLGLEAMNLDGQPFDPTHAEAVLHEPGEGDTPIVSEVLRSGYTWKGRVLRPAMVKVRG